ncbi:glycosyltransferase family 52 [Salinisphaera hydrothermalis]|uniref:glycosyltransferase family 52 n=1 Tax=Salinisphaera hydrothermalis TaxID=563188 RepID=UPI003342A90C
MAEKHFTLYPQYPNISPNLFEVNLFSQPAQCEPGKVAEPRVVLLGTVYREIVGNQEYLDCLLGRIQCLINTFGSHVVTYLPHPRDEQPYFDNVVLGDAEKISEDVVLSLLQEFSHVELIGFCSSTQFNFMNEPRVHNTVIRTSLVSDSWRDLSLMLVGNGAATIDIDAYVHHGGGMTVWRVLAFVVK